MRVAFADRALNDLEALRDYIAADNPVAAREQVQKILAQVRVLEHQPKLGRPGRVQDTRELVISGTRYIAAYFVDTDIVRILAVIHSSMRWPSRF